MVLAGWTTHQGKAGQADHRIHQGKIGVERILEKGVHRLGEIKATAEHRNDGGAAVFQLLDHSHIVGLVTGDDVAAL